MGFWALRGKANAERKAQASHAEGDSLRAELERSSLARFQAERQKEFAETYLDNLMKGNEELKRVYDAEKAASNEAIAQAVEAKKQTRAKEAALKNEQQARTEEKAQRDLADARALLHRGAGYLAYQGRDLLHLVDDGGHGHTRFTGLARTKLDPIE